MSKHFLVRVLIFDNILHCICDNIQTDNKKNKQFNSISTLRDKREWGFLWKTDECCNLVNHNLKRGHLTIF